MVILKQGLFGLQVCVPKGVSDDEIVKMANGKNPAGTRNGWFIVEDGNTMLLGSPAAVECADDCEREHRVLEC